MKIFLLPILLALMPFLSYAQNPDYFNINKNDVSLLEGIEKMEEPNDLESKTVICPTEAKINEFHYDDGGADENEFVEVVIPTGGDPTEVIIYLYNGFDGSVYDSYPLSVADFVSNDGTFDYYVWYPSGIQNGNDGIAIACADGFQIQFFTYMGSFVGTAGPFDGLAGVDIGVFEDGFTNEGQSLQCDGSGFWYEECDASPGIANDLSTCTVIDCPGLGNFGGACDDNDATTLTDTIGVNCICAGTPIVYDCPTLLMNFNDPCDDNDPTTENDFINLNCDCAGSLIDFDCPAQMVNIGDPCDDGIDITANDMIIQGCNCVGTSVGA